MKKLLLILLVLIGCIAEASAEIVGVTPKGEYIHSFPADNGQTLYFFSYEDEPCVFREDVNFDGSADIVVRVGAGARFELFEFFVWEGERYVLAMHPCTTDYRIKGPISDYELYPEQGLVYAYVNTGENGNHFIKYLMRWEGTDLALLRRAESAVYESHDLEDGIPVNRQYWDQAEINVADYSHDQWGSILYTRIIPLSEMNEAIHREIDEALWQGLK